MIKQKIDLFPDYDNKNFSEAILSKKEYNIFSNIEQNTNEKLLINIEQNIRENNILQLQSYQLFIQNFFNPDTPYNRLLIKWEVGMGKTIAALSIANKFIQLYKKRYLVNENDDKIGKIIVIGYTKSTFINDLFKFPEFGYIKRKEIQQIYELNYSIKKNPNDNYSKKILEDLTNNIKRRIKNKKFGGFFDFYGYKELVNRLFIYDQNKLNIHDMSEHEINKELEEGNIEIDSTFIDSMKYSLLICDEIHNVYNSIEKNNWGVAIQTILNTEKTIKAIYLSATPLTHSPTEIIDLLSLLYHKKITLNKKDFFDNNEELLPEALEKIFELSIGKISFLKDMNPKYFAKKKFVGENISGIEYLKFIRCPMSELHYNTYKILEDNENILDISHLLDIVIPDPNENNIGIFKTADIKHKILMASKEWKLKNKIEYQGDKIKGNFLLIENMKYYSSKYYIMYNKIIELLQNKRGKIFIYHKFVNVFGVFFIEDFLTKNGFIKYGTIPNNSSLCFKCLKQMNNHKESHEFTPIKIIIVHGEISNNQINNDLAMFNSPSNTDGNECFILIGSKKIQESYNLVSVRNVFIMSKPPNISTFNQIIGRASRQKSHILLPLKDQNIDIFIFVSSHPKYERLLYEENDYKKAIKKYITIQKIERILHSNSIDSIINQNIIWPKIVKDEYDTSNELQFSMLKYKIPTTKSYNINDIDKTFYDVYYSHDEFNNITIIIKRLFIQVSRVWDYDKLLQHVKNPPFTVYFNTKLINEEIFVLALTYLIWNTNTQYINNTLIKRKDLINIYARLYDPDDKIILLPGNKIEKYVICQVGKYYVLFPLNDKTRKSNIDVELPYRTSEKKIHTKLVNINYMIDILSKKKLSIDLLVVSHEHISKISDISNISLIKDYSYSDNIIIIEDMLEYFHNIINNKNNNEEKLETYIKLLIYYNINHMIIWYNSINEELIKNFEQHYKSKLTNDDVKNNILKKIKITSAESKQLFKTGISYYTSECYIITCYQQQYSNLLMDELLNTYKNINKSNKLPKDLFPIGYCGNQIKLLDPIQGWIRQLHIINHINYVENDVIIGYNIYDNGIKFKIKPPSKSMIKFTDHRLIEKGIVCVTKSKKYLLSLCKKLSIDVDNAKQTIRDICELIKKNIIMNQIISYNKGEKVRWFYMLSELDI